MSESKGVDEKSNTIRVTHVAVGSTELFWQGVSNAVRVLCQLLSGAVNALHAPDVAEVSLAELASRDVQGALAAVKGEAVAVKCGPLTAMADEGVAAGEDHAMVLAAMVIGYNVLAEDAETLGSKVQFRLLREHALRQLQETGSKQWSVTFATPTAPSGEIK